MGNPQGTLTQYIAGLFEGEGSVAITPIMAKSKQGKKMPQFRTWVFITNTEPEIIQKVIDFYKLHEWSYYIRTDIRKNRKHLVCYSIMLNKQADRLEFLELMVPHLVGLKKKQARATIDYLRYRVKIAEEWQRERGGDGKYKVGTGSSYSDIDREYYLKYKQIKDTSETKRKTAVTFG